MNINQKYIDLHLLCCSGYGNVDYAYDDCKIIQKAIQDGFGVTLSIADDLKRQMEAGCIMPQIYVPLQVSHIFKKEEGDK
jgi:hypothetical protein